VMKHHLHEIVSMRKKELEDQAVEMVRELHEIEDLEFVRERVVWLVLPDVTN